MFAPNDKQNVQELPLKMVGGTHYGRYAKISFEESWNFIVSDGFLVPYAGYKNKLTLNPSAVGRGLYTSYRANIMIAVIGAEVYSITANSAGDLMTGSPVGMLATTTGDVYIAENNNSEIAITDNVNVYVYNFTDGSFKTSIESGSPSGTQFLFPFSAPGFISFQNGVLIIACGSTTNWVLSGFNDATSWSTLPGFVGSLQSKPDFVQAAVPVPGGGNNLFVFGRNVTEQWQFTASAAIFPYIRNSVFNLDYGCINPATIASLRNYVVWIGVNEQSGPVLMVATGNSLEQISTDGIDYTLGNLTDPTNCTGFLYQQDGHLLYQFTFPTDNISFAYDFETKLFFNVSDENLNYHIARQIVYFDNTYYFVSLNGGNIYEFDTLFSDADYGDGLIYPIPRIRITPPVRRPDQMPFIIKSVGFTIEQGLPNIVTDTIVYENTYVNLATEAGDLILCENGDQLCIETVASTTPIAYNNTSQAAVYLSISRDGAQNFGNQWRKDMNPTGYFKSRFLWQQCGRANDATFQFKFVGFTRFTCTDGVIYWYE